MHFSCSLNHWGKLLRESAFSKQKQKHWKQSRCQAKKIRPVEYPSVEKKKKKMLKVTYDARMDTRFSAKLSLMRRRVTRGLYFSLTQTRVSIHPSSRRRQEKLRRLTRGFKSPVVRPKAQPCRTKPVSSPDARVWFLWPTAGLTCSIIQKTCWSLGQRASFQLPSYTPNKKEKKFLDYSLSIRRWQALNVEKKCTTLIDASRCTRVPVK